jgi:2-methylcitrate dehydratase PrpD
MCMPLESRRAPAAAVDAKFSLPFCVALAVTRGRIQISDFNAAALHDPYVLAIAQKVVPVDDKRFDWRNRPLDGRVEFVTRDGRVLPMVGDDFPGSPASPLTWDDLAAKFRDCATVAASPISAERIERAQAMARSLETLDDAADLIRVLA